MTISDAHTTVDGQSFEFCEGRHGNRRGKLQSDNNNSSDFGGRCSHSHSLSLQSQAHLLQQEENYEERVESETSDDDSDIDSDGWTEIDWGWLSPDGEDDIPDPNKSSSETAFPKAQGSTDMAGTFVRETERKFEPEPAPSSTTAIDQSIPERTLLDCPRRGTKRFRQQTKADEKTNGGDDRIIGSKIFRLEAENSRLNNGSRESDHDVVGGNSEDDKSETSHSMCSQQPQQPEKQGGKTREQCDLILKAHWNAKFQLLKDHKNQHGWARIPNSHPTLGPWVQSQRDSYLKGKLHGNQISRLRSIGLVLDRDEDEWEAMYERLLAYREKHKTVHVPQTCVEDPELANWVQKQRARCPRQDWVDGLNEIGFAWTKMDAQWDVMFQKLVAYNEIHHTANVPRSCKKHPKLAGWVKRQREYCKRQDRIDQLNQIGFIWKPNNAVREARYHRLMAYHKKHNTAVVPERNKEESVLAQWVASQRQNCSRAADRIDLLNQSGLSWNAP
eukprot:CAMPEP_0172407358 /NCGR_PEP_ID=MMETSP1061-20121228/74202_1 /TAXON_ID=37318 /ORGANISM="Pseudo-nitzschia pungens, Strain cf. pungens" /LENGTH=501 /DNA_ID=CAMNT_0013143345 /DNA_START=126 /DNA_END=1631 /DNA_ORIENTATION=+